MNQPLGLSKAFHDLTSHARGSSRTARERRENDRSHVQNSSPGNITSIMHRRVSTYYIMSLLMEKRREKKISLGISIYHFSINICKSNKRLTQYLSGSVISIECSKVLQMQLKRYTYIYVLIKMRKILIKMRHHKAHPLYAHPSFSFSLFPGIRDSKCFITRCHRRRRDRGKRK